MTSTNQALIGWRFIVQAPNERTPRCYAAGAPVNETHSSLIDQIARAEALVGDYLSITNEKVKFDGPLTNGQIRQLDLKAGEVKPI